MRKIIFFLLNAVLAGVTFSACSTASNEQNLSRPMGSFRPPQGKNEAAVLAKMEGPWFESKIIHLIVIRAFSDNQEALANFFQKSYQSTKSAAGSEMRNDFTLSLFYYWGDHRFANILSQQTADVRRGIGSHLWVGSENAAVFSKVFPETDKAAFISEI